MATPHERTVDGLELQMATNHFGPFALTGLLLDALAASGAARVVTVSSLMARSVRGVPLADPRAEDGRYRRWEVYGRSKLANVLFTYELARRLEGTSVTANALHPGVVLTGFGQNNGGLVGVGFSIYRMIGKPFTLSPEQGARTSVYLASSPDVEGVTGKYFANSKETESNDASHDAEAQRRLWAESERMVGLAATA